jgi:hypothetical protein
MRWNDLVRARELCTRVGQRLSGLIRSVASRRWDVAPVIASRHDATFGVLAPWSHMSSRYPLRCCLLVASMLVAACGGSPPRGPTPTTPTPTPGPDVYVAGNESNGTRPVAKVWKNGVGTPLADGSRDSAARSMAIAGSDVYVAGFASNGTHWVATVWKNGVAVPLTDGTTDSDAWSVAVSGSDVYAVGYEFDPTYWVARFWKNGVGAPLTDGRGPANATSVTVSGSDVYVVGFESNGRHPVASVWRNGVPTDLTDGTTDASAWSVCPFPDVMSMSSGTSPTGRIV